MSDLPETEQSQVLTRGVCLWLTGLSGAGKSMTAKALLLELKEIGVRAVIFDGDDLRRTDSPPLGFSKPDRDAQVDRVATLASIVVGRGDAAVCALISPYRTARAQARLRVGSDRFLELFVDTPLAVCEARDAKGLYARARRGDLQFLTGIDDPYEAPESPDLVLHTTVRTAEENAHHIVALLQERNFLSLAPNRRTEFST